MDQVLLREIMMGYNLSRHSVIRNKPQLDQMLESKVTITFPTTQPARLAYKLREAIRAAKEHEDLRKYYDELNDLYTFKETPYAVIAEVEDQPVGIVGEEEVMVKRNTKPIPPPKPPSKKTMPDVINLLEVLAVAVKFDEDEELFFPNAVLSYEDSIVLHRWTQDKEWKYINQAEKGTTLTKKDVPEEVLFKPEGE